MAALYNIPLVQYSGIQQKNRFDFFSEENAKIEDNDHSIPKLVSKPAEFSWNFDRNFLFSMFHTVLEQYQFWKIQLRMCCDAGNAWRLKFL